MGPLKCTYLSTPEKIPFCEYKVRAYSNNRDLTIRKCELRHKTAIVIDSTVSKMIISAYLEI